MSQKHLTAKNAESAEIVLTREQRQDIAHAKDYHVGFAGGFKQQMGYAFLAGRALNRLKESLPHGQFETVAELEMPEIKDRSRRHYMKFQIALIESLPAHGKTATVAVLADVSKTGELSDKGKEEVFKAVHKLADGKSLTQMYRDLGMIRDVKPEGGFRPNAGAVQEWLKEKHPELAGTKFDELPAEVQRAFKKFWGNRKVTPGEKEAALWDKGINMLESVGECHDEKWFANPQGDAPLKHIERAALLFQDCADDLKAFLAKAAKKKN